MSSFLFIYLHFSKYNSFVGFLHIGHIHRLLPLFLNRQVLFSLSSHSDLSALCTGEACPFPPLLWWLNPRFSCKYILPDLSGTRTISNILSFGPENMIAIARVFGNCLFQMFGAGIGISWGLKASGSVRGIIFLGAAFDQGHGAATRAVWASSADVVFRSVL